jgi:uncharacterized protein YoxC
MPPWLALILAVCAVALTVALVWAIWAFGRLGRRAERVLAVVEQELERDVPPLVSNLRELTGELRVLSAGLNTEVERIGLITERVQEVADAAAGLLTALSGLTRAGQLIGIAAGVKTGVDVFLHRLRKPRGEDGHE